MIKRRGAPTPYICSEYLCPEHGRFTVDIERTADGDAPDEIACPIMCDHDHHCEDPPCGDCGFTIYECGRAAEWVISSPLGRVNHVSIARGKWQKPESKAWLDTRDLGEGMDHNEWIERRRKIREQEREKEIKAFTENWKAAT